MKFKRYHLLAVHKRITRNADAKRRKADESA